MHHCVTEMCTHVHISVSKRCIVGYGNVVMWHLCHRSIYNCRMSVIVFTHTPATRLLVEQGSNFLLTKYIPYLALTGELWEVYCERSGDKWLNHCGTFPALSPYDLCHQAVRQVMWSPHATDPSSRYRQPSHGSPINAAYLIKACINAHRMVCSSWLNYQKGMYFLLVCLDTAKIFGQIINTLIHYTLLGHGVAFCQLKFWPMFYLKHCSAIVQCRVILDLVLKQLYHTRILIHFAKPINAFTFHGQLLQAGNFVSKHVYTIKILPCWHKSTPFVYHHHIHAGIFGRCHAWWHPVLTYNEGKNGIRN